MTAVRRPSLGARISLLAVSIAVLTALVGGVISVNLLQRASEQTARRALAAIADDAQATAALSPSAAVGQARARRALLSIGIGSGVIRIPPGQEPAVVGDPLAAQVLTPAQVRDVAAGSSLSLRLPQPDGVVLVEARPTRVGGLVLAQRRGDAVALGGQALRQLSWLLVVTGLVAAALGLLVAWRISLPLKRTAAAAGALAGGARDVVLPETGPQEVAEVASSVNRLAAALSHSEARQREFLLSVSHDLRTPLTAITGYAESLADGVVPSDRLREVGAVIGTEARRLERMVADLLDLARLDASEVSMHPGPVDLVDLAEAAGQSWEHRCAADGVELAVEVRVRPLIVNVDAQRLRQALDGLLENALRVTPRGAPIVLSVAAETGEAVLQVRDGGPGLTDADLPVAFERSVLHERYRGAREVGTGLGLAIVHRIVERLGGRIEAGHAPEGGACFTIRLPLVQSRTPPRSPRPDGAALPGGNRAGGLC